MHVLGVTSPVLRKCQSVRCGADMECLGSLAHRLEGPSLRSALQPVPPLLAHARYGHPLRFYIMPHCPQCPPVATLKLRLVPVTACAPYRVKATGIMQSGLRWGRSHSRRRFPVAGAPLWVCLHRGISQALRAVCLVSGLRPVMWYVPPPARGPRRCAAWLRAELPVRPPRGLPQSAQNRGQRR